MGEMKHILMFPARSVAEIGEVKTPIYT